MQCCTLPATGLLITLRAKNKIVVFHNVAEDSQKLFQNKAEDVSFLLVYRLMGVGALIQSTGLNGAPYTQVRPRYVPRHRKVNRISNERFSEK